MACEKRFKVVNSDCIHGNDNLEREFFEKHGIDYELSPGIDEATLAAACKDADAVYVSYAEITRPVIEAMEHCKLIVRVGTGYNNIDEQAATDCGIMVANVRDYCMDEVADHTMAMMLSILRRTCQLNTAAHQGIWNPDLSHPMVRLSTLTLGLYGFGGIAKTVAQRALAFGMKVIAFDPYQDPDSFAPRGVQRIDTEEELLKNCDVLSIHIPLMDSTAGIMNKAKFDLMKEGSIFLNMARGGLVNEADLVETLENGHLAAAATDVLSVEHPEADHPFLHCDKIILTPHVAYYSEQSLIDLRTIAMDEIVDTFEGKHPRFLLNGKALGLN